MESRYSRLQGEMRDAYFLIQDSCIQILSSPALGRIGYKEEDLLEQPFIKVFPPETHEDLIEAYQELIKGDMTSNRVRTDLVAGDGTRIPIEISAWPAFYKDKPAVAGIVLDMSGREKGEQALVESEEKLRVMLESIADGIAVIDFESRIQDMNTQMLHFYGYDRKEDVIGRSAFEFIPKEYMSAAIDNMEKALTEGHGGHLEMKLVDKNGLEYETEISGAPLKDRAGQPKGFIAVTKDISERKNALREIEYRLLFEELIANISTRFINYTPEEIEEGIAEALKEIAEFSKVDRSHACLFSENGTYIQQIFEWNAPGIDSDMNVLDGASIKKGNWWMSKLQDLETIQMSTTNDLPNNAHQERGQIGLDNVRSSLTVPIHHSGNLLGFLGFHSLKKEKIWADEDIALLKIVGETFANALARKHAEESLRDAEELNRTLVETASKAGEGLAVFQDKDDGKSVCLFVNDEFVRIAGYSYDDLLEKESPDNISRILNESWKQDSINESSSRFELDLVRKNGELISVDIGVVATIYKGEPATVVYVTDITERKKQEAINLELQETLKFYSNQVVKASKELVHAIRGVNSQKYIQNDGKYNTFRQIPMNGDVELLTAREIQVLQLAARGMSNKDIGEELGITIRTVKGHLMNIFTKMNVKSRTEAVSCALKEGWITLEDMGYEII